MSEGENDTCLELALEGEKLCKAGKCRDGVAFFEAALQSGTDDFRYNFDCKIYIVDSDCW